ncbi:SsrA-binding protein [Candidatus Saccharibacteria bacterium]|nr:SsrA-binding protein [Candidatus Saccharibacteria bacterium]
MKKPKLAHNVLNRRAKFDYELGDELVVGVQLNGREVRAARDGHVSLKGSFVTIRRHELWLNNASFTLKLNQKGGSDTTVDTNARRLLATKHQIVELERRHQDGLSLVPIKLMVGGRYIKLVMAVGKGKKRYDKRETIKRRDQEREMKRVTG